MRFRHKHPFFLIAAILIGYNTTIVLGQAPVWDAASSSSAASCSGTLSWSHTIGSVTKPYLTVAVSYDPPGTGATCATDQISGTWNGTGMTNIYSGKQTCNIKLAVLGLASAATGTHTIDITHTTTAHATAHEISGVANSYAGATAYSSAYCGSLLTGDPASSTCQPAANGWTTDYMQVAYVGARAADINSVNIGPLLAENTQATSNTATTRYDVSDSVFTFDLSASVQYVEYVLAIYDGSLPISLLYIEPVLSANGSVSIRWATASEENNHYFVVERSVDAENYEPVTLVDGAGNSNSFIEYLAVDENPPKSETVYYRIKQVDYDGQFTYSEPIPLSNRYKNSPGLLVFPNPVRSGPVAVHVMGEFDENISVGVMDLLGKEIYRHTFIPGQSNSFEIDNARLAPGTYFVQGFMGKGTLSIPAQMLVVPEK